MLEGQTRLLEDEKKQRQEGQKERRTGGILSNPIQPYAYIAHK